MTMPTAHDRPASEPRPSVSGNWYDSSLDLKHGLVVTEHGALDPLADAPAAPAVFSEPRAEEEPHAESFTHGIRPRGEAGR